MGEAAILLFKVSDEMKEKHTPETDLTRHHYDLEVADWLESSALEFVRWCILACLRMDTL